jgi:hypothetical protein
MVFLPSGIVLSSPGFLSFMWFTLFPNMPGVHYPRSPTFPSSPVGGGSQDRRSMMLKSRSELSEDVIIQLDSAAGEAREDGGEELALILRLLY